MSRALSIHKRALISRAIRGDFGRIVRSHIGSAMMSGEASHYYGDSQAREHWAMAAAWHKIKRLNATGARIQ